MNMHGEVKVIYKNPHASKGIREVIEFGDESKFMRIEQVCKVTGFSKCTIYRAIKEDRFPKQRKIGLRNVVFVRAEIDAWIQSVINS